MCFLGQKRPIWRFQLFSAVSGVFSLDLLSPVNFPVTGKSPELLLLVYSGAEQAVFVYCGVLLCAGFYCWLFGTWNLFSGSFVASGFGLVVLGCCLFSSMSGGRKRFVTIESKSFDFVFVGSKEACLQITEYGRGRRFTIVLPEEVALWLLRAWSRFGQAKSLNWRNQCRRGSSIFLLESKRNRAGKFLQLSVINRGRQSFIIFPGGWKGKGWS